MVLSVFGGNWKGEVVGRKQYENAVQRGSPVDVSVALDARRHPRDVVCGDYCVVVKEC